MDALPDPVGALQALVHWLQQWLFEGLVQPILFRTGAMRHAEDLFELTEWVVLGAIEVLVLAAILIPLERRFAVEAVVDRRAVNTDVLYTLLHRLGGFALLVFAVLTPAMDAIEAQLRLVGFSRPNLDQLWPGFTDLPLVSFLIYLVVLDFVDYWLHRGQHAFRWWWELHALHHSQRQMTFWSDQRNHLLDDLIRDAMLASVALLVGVAPAQFVMLVVAARVIESVQHANLRWRFGRIGERLLVSPSFHRLHHAVGVGHEGPARGVNFAVLLPCWDLLFGTADFRPGFVPTGIRDQLDGREYGKGFWSQQWLALLRIAGRA
jgi:sterol desaturase/sphingolipid hydroxylase (fatty acid hydroxylase superfamily)